MRSFTAVPLGRYAAWYFLAFFFVLATAGGFGFAAILQRPDRWGSTMLVKRRSGVTKPGFDAGDGFLCLVFVAACIWAFVFGGSWFRYFFVAAVGAGLVVAVTMYAGRRAVERFGYPSQRDSERELD